MNKKYHYVYKIVNKLNNKYYIGVHNTNNLKDGYMGSGEAIKKAVKKHGRDNFEKIILKYFNTPEEAFKYEEQLVTESLVNDPMCYNLTTGGGAGGVTGFVTVRDKDNNIFQVSVDDPRYLSGELVHNTKGYSVVKDKNGNPFQISISDPNYDKYESVNKGYTIVKDDLGNNIRISINDPNYKNYDHINKHKVLAKDKDGNIIKVSINDPHWLSGELVGITKGYVTVKDESGNKIRVQKGDSRFITGELKGYRKDLVTVKDKDGNKITIKNTDPRYLSGELKAIFTGHMWIVNKNNECKHIPREQFDKYNKEGWVRGRKWKLT